MGIEKVETTDGTLVRMRHRDGQVIPFHVVRPDGEKVPYQQFVDSHVGAPGSGSPGPPAGSPSLWDKLRLRAGAAGPPLAAGFLGAVGLELLVRTFRLW